MKAIQTVLGIMDRRSRLLGMEVQKVDLQVTGATDVRHSLAGEDLATVGLIDYRTESMQLFLTSTSLKKKNDVFFFVKIVWINQS